VKEGGEPSLFLAPSQQFMVGGAESEGIVLTERRTLDMIASHGGTPPPTV
jgi:hypothetical protein